MVVAPGGGTDGVTALGLAVLVARCAHGNHLGRADILVLPHDAAAVGRQLSLPVHMGRPSRLTPLFYKEN